jgi:hypothetical protein
MITILREGRTRWKAPEEGRFDMLVLLARRVCL